MHPPCSRKEMLNSGGVGWVGVVHAHDLAETRKDVLSQLPSCQQVKLLAILSRKGAPVSIAAAVGDISWREGFYGLSMIIHPLAYTPAGPERLPPRPQRGDYQTDPTGAGKCHNDQHLPPHQPPMAAQDQCNAVCQLDENVDTK